MAEKTGDDGFTAEVPEEHELWYRIEVAKQRIEDKTITREQALEIYGLTEEQLPV